MPYIIEMHYCSHCGVYLGAEDGDGVCYDCSENMDEDGYIIYESKIKESE